MQYFQRSRFEYHPQLPEIYQITLGLLGEELAEKVGPRGQFWVTGLPVTPITQSDLSSLQIAVQNVGIGRWFAQGPKAVSVGYRWLDGNGVTVLEGGRETLPSLVPAGSVASLGMSVTTPALAGQYTLQWDLWEEGRGWAALRDSSATTRQGLAVQGPLPTANAHSNSGARYHANHRRGRHDDPGGRILDH